VQRVSNLYGYAGKVIWVNLTKSSIRIRPLENLALQYIGGKGYGAKILFEMSKPKTDPYDPSNLLIFAT